MFRRKLQCLKHHSVDSVDVSKENDFRALVVWLEDQKIRHYKPEDRKALRDIKSDAWTPAFSKYLADLEFPFEESDRTSIMDWLLGHAVRLEYADNAEELTKTSEIVASVGKTTSQSSEQQQQQQHRFDVDSTDFKAGATSLAKLFDLPAHTNHLKLFQAVALLVEQQLSPQARDQAKADKKSRREKQGNKLESVPLADTELGFDLSDPVLRNAAKVLRILHIAELRELQTKINEVIVAVQKLTANPKTDQRLGKVGR
ncbi:RNA transcription, translation and transport factor protein-like [Oscarella lobularis]|uniref:RNA transcription, translation and transport factor protein-like n=1 Tax=Oscarella lobularis TaxID=121494 RepID=UPI0033142BBF